MNCTFEKYMQHNKIRNQFRQTFIQCPLLEREDAGMSSLGIICGGCCIRIQQLSEAKKDLLLRQVINIDDYKRNPEIIEEYLPEHLLNYYKALKKLGKTMDDVSSECSRCKPESIEGKPVYSSKNTEMTECGRDDLR